MTIDEPAIPRGDSGLVRVRLDLAYDGTDFSGWASQPGLRTVQQTLQEALAVALRVEPGHVTLTVAGRTDAGVHARSQVAHCDLPPAAWHAMADPVQALAGLLPRDIRVRSVAPAPAGFDARFSASSRRYAYRLCDDRWGPDPLRRRDVAWHRRGPLDLALLTEAARPLVGLHDFGAFCRHRDGATAVRTLLQLSWERAEDRLVVATVTADAFCHSMVRSLIGALIPVGEGRRPVDWPAALLAARTRDPAVHVAPAHGLTLEEVTYPPADQLAERVSITRRPRGTGHPPR